LTRVECDFGDGVPDTNPPPGVHRVIVIRSSAQVKVNRPIGTTEEGDG
jgi:hypothetical protein